MKPGESGNVSFDYAALLKTAVNAKLEPALMADEQKRPLFLLLKEYGIRGVDAVEFLAKLATVTQQIQPGGDGK